ncbi:MAG: DUF502 domain-containing protein [Dehalococcoidia bacterium]
MPDGFDEQFRAPTTVRSKITGHLRQTLIAGVLALIPLVATVLVVQLVFFWIDDQVQPIVKEIFGREITGVGVGLTIVAVYLTGLVVANFLGRAIIHQCELVILRIPIIRWIYGIVKQTIDGLRAAGHAKFRVVLIQWPKKGTYTIGFQTGTMTNSDGKKYFSVLIPTTPTPQTGLLAIVPEDEVVPTNLSVEEGVRLVVSSGVLAPKDLMQVLKTSRPGDSDLQEEDREAVGQPRE